MRRCRLILVSLALFGVTESKLHAQRVTGYFTGTVTEVDDQGHVFPNLLVGDPVIGMYSYDTTATDADPDPSRGNYAQSLGGPPNGAVVTVGPYAFPHMGSLLTAEVHNDRSSPVFDMLWLGSELEGPDNVLGAVVSVMFKDSSLAWLSSDALPPAVPDVEELTSRVGTLYADAEGDPIVTSTVEFDITYLSADPIGACCAASPSTNCLGLMTEAECLALPDSEWKGAVTSCQACLPAVPATSIWGAVALGLLLLTAGTLAGTRRYHRLAC